MAYTWRADFNVDESPVSLDIQDTTTYVDEKVILGLLKCTLTGYGVFYNNTSWKTPDIQPYNNAISDTKIDIPLPIDVDDYMLGGSYTLEYKVRVYSNPTTAAINTITQATKTFNVVDGTGAFATLAGGNNVFYVAGSTANNRGYTVASATWDTINSTDIVVNETIPSAVADGNFTALNTYTEYTWDGAGGSTIDTTLKKTLYVSYSPITSDVDVSASCVYSQITATDNTSYTITINGSTFVGTSSRTYIFRPPTTTPTVQADITRAAAAAVEVYGGVGTEIWTRHWRILMSNSVQWSLGSDVYLNAIISADEDCNVVCDDCECQLFNCIEALFVRFAELRTTNPTQANLLDNKVRLVQMYMQLYNAAKNCGNTTKQQEYCDLIVDIINDAQCTCESTSTTSVRVYATRGTSSSSTVTGAQILYGTSLPPSNSVGSNGDTYINTTLGYVYKKTAGSWVYQLTIIGAAGSTAVTSKILYNDNTATQNAASASTQTIKTYTLPAGTLATDGSEVYVETLLLVAATIELENGTAIIFGSSGASILLYSDGLTPFMVGTYVKWWARIVRVDATNQKIYSGIEYLLPSGSKIIDYPGYVSATETLANPLAININIDKALAGGVADVIAYQLRVTHTIK